MLMQSRINTLHCMVNGPWNVSIGLIKESTRTLEDLQNQFEGLFRDFVWNISSWQNSIHDKPKIWSSILNEICSPHRHNDMKTRHKVTHRQIYTCRDTVDINNKGMIGTEQGREPSRPVWWKRTLFPITYIPVDPEYPCRILCQTAAVLHQHSHFLHLNTTQRHGHNSGHE